MTSAINVPVGVSADGAAAAADAKPIIPIEQAVRELEQVFLPRIARWGRCCYVLIP